MEIGLVREKRGEEMDHFNGNRATGLSVERRRYPSLIETFQKRLKNFFKKARGVSIQPTSNHERREK
jgi:hypothetical protein